MEYIFLGAILSVLHASEAVYEGYDKIAIYSKVKKTKTFAN